ncbi:hypothetical protein [Azospirillum canadense]|uniref:hypothetical protein n=1 Tax=Azospirillum canadense TaxID=403962 RepID=UPI002225D7F9|nr:hypothetical protein [Azospirillum canadense]MCW2242227.1 hypothetical protein [Azospirillum canadense]
MADIVERLRNRCALSNCNGADTDMLGAANLIEDLRRGIEKAEAERNEAAKMLVTSSEAGARLLAERDRMRADLEADRTAFGFVLQRMTNDDRSQPDTPERARFMERSNAILDAMIRLDAALGQPPISEERRP